MKQVVFPILVVMLMACSGEGEVIPTPPRSSNPGSDSTPEPPPALDIAQHYLNKNLADGFDYAIGNTEGKGSYTAPNGKTYNGWYIATETAEEYSLGIHTGEDWNGNGGGNTDLGQPVYAIAKGKVLEAANYGAPWGNIVVIEHVFLENHQVDTVFSVYAHLDTILIEKGTLLQRRQQLGTIGDGNGSYPAHLHLEIRKASMKEKPADFWPSSNGWSVAQVKQHYHNPTPFIKSHRKLEVPALAEDFLLAEKSSYSMRHYEKGKLQQTYEIALSQNPKGHKVEQGDLRLPEGLYHLIQLSDGPFRGDMGPFFGTGWMRINYPNPYDIEAGRKKGWISSAKAKEMTARWRSMKEPDKTTRLGGGIGIHGWNGSWKNYDSRHLTWGCISMHNEDLSALYPQLQKGTLIIILP